MVEFIGIIVILILIYAAVYNLACVEGEGDYQKIRDKIKINHTISWVWRGTYVSFLNILLLIFSISWYNIFILISNAFFFSLFFRKHFNELRKKDIFYIKQTNGYDTFFLKLSTKRGGYIATVTEISISIFGLLAFLILKFYNL